MKNLAGQFRRHPVATYFVLTYVLAWTVWIPLAVARRGTAGDQVNLSVTLLAGAAPGVAASIAAWAAFGRKGVSYLWGRLGRWRIRPSWFLAAFVIPAAMPVLTVMLFGIFSNQPGPLFAGISPLSLVSGLLVYIPMAVFEEVGWRGLAQPGLQSKLSAAAASSIVGLAWSVWHLPYFLIPEFSFFPEGTGFALGFALYCVGTIPTCLLIAWLFNNSDGSLVLPCIFHGTTNVFSGTFLIPVVRAAGLGALAVSVVLSALVALIIVLAFGPHRLSRAAAPSGQAAFTLLDAQPRD